MKNAKVTVSLWSNVDDDRAANVNGGIGYIRLAIAGGIGAAQPEGDDSQRVKVYAIGNSPNYHGFHLHKRKYHHYY